jgi:serine/threonine protein kinase
MARPGSLPYVLPPGTRLAKRYVIGELIGDGGMARVYHGVHETIDRAVAIKVLDPEFSRDPSVVVRFLQEARASSKVRHENVVEITDFGETEDGRPFMVMESLEGEELAATLCRDGALPWERARPMLLQILAALQAAHDKGVIHRDMKPENVFRITQMANDDFLKVFDFGIAKVLRDAGSVAQALTLDGQVLGTPAYMSPEQCLGERVDARSDLYSVGIIAFEMLTGILPFEEDDPNQLMFCHVHDPLPPMAAAAPFVDVDPRVEALIVRVLSKDRDERFSSALEFADALLADVDPARSGLLNTLRGLFPRRP